MRVAITADIHLAAKGKYPERYRALESIFKQVEAENIDTLIIAGDLFDKDFHNYSEFEKICKKHLQIMIHIIPGNHDPGINMKNIVGSNIHIYTAPEVIDIGTTTFLFIPYEKQTKMGEKIASKEEEIKGENWILIGHGDYYGGVKELNPLETGTYMPLSRNNVEAFTPRATFLGHIHKTINWGDVYYVGSPCGLDIGETGKRKFLVYDTEDRSVECKFVATDILYFKESFIVVPLDDEVALLKHQIAETVKSWNIDTSDYSKVIVRVEAIGYAMDRSAILSALSEGFNGFKYYKDEGPLIEKLSTSTDRQLSKIVERTMTLIDELEWDFIGNELERDLLKIEALNVIYGNCGT